MATWIEPPASGLALPVLRRGEEYYSLETRVLDDIRTGEAVANVGQASAGMIARDLRDVAEYQKLLDGFTVDELLKICTDAAHHLAESTLPLGLDADGNPVSQSPDDYLAQLAATTGMPLSMGRANLAKLVGVLADMPKMLDGLTRGLDLSILDGGWGEQNSRSLSFLRLTESLGAVLPNNSPGVHGLWMPAVPLKVPLVLRPGSREPWTPIRVARAFVAAGLPPQAISIYPTNYDGAAELMLRTGRSLFYGDASTVEAWKGSSKVQIHGPGWSKVLLAPDSDWHDHLDLLVSSIAKNGGRSCINCSSVWLPADGSAGDPSELAEAAAAQLAAIEPKTLDDPDATLAAFPDPAVARAISQMIDQQLEQEGAVDVTARHYGIDESGAVNRVVEVGGCTFLRPTLIHCTDPSHPLAHAEYGFPFAAVVEVDANEIFDTIGPTLIGTVISDDPTVRQRAMIAPHIDRINLGAIPTWKISWDQPHEGNLFDHLYQQRAFQMAV
ncbi:MAG: aldehyde dehydrogenase family protein [Acidobacteriota bacterium]